ncbi:MAG TPA: hypothetical protein IAB11_00420 [Candidatus Ornithoclostridium faecavium]|nr:hypothetical protein [Candidatus Ornithoclostridium faecavium]
MDEKELKRLLEKELDALTPSMSEKVRKAPVLKTEEKREKSAHKIDVRPVKRNIRPYIYGAVAAVLVIAIALAVIIPGVFGGGEDVTPTYSAGYLRMDINPSVEIVYDSNNKVTVVKSANSDADVLLSDELRAQLKGMPVDQAAATIADEAGKLGYIEPEEQDALKITVVAGTDKQSEEVASKATAAIENTFMERGIFVAVLAVKENADWLAEQYGTVSGDLKQAVNGVAEKADNYFQQLAEKNQNGLEALRQYYEKEVFEYLKDLLEAECAKISRTRVILHEIKSINDDISEYTGLGWFGGYWETVNDEKWQSDPAMVEKFERMESALKKLYDLREDDITFSSSMGLDTVVGLYDEFVNEDWISGLGNATLDELKGKLDDIVNALKSLNVQITSAIRDAVAFVPSTVEDFLDGTENVINGMRAELSDIYYEYYSEDREEYSREDYDDFYLAIVNEYGSLEAYWNSRQ